MPSLRKHLFLIVVTGSFCVPALASESRAAGELGWNWAGAADHPFAIAVFGGEASQRVMTRTIRKAHEFKGTGDNVGAIALTRDIAWFRRILSIEGEVLYARHFGNERYDEFGFAVNLRWHAFPWNRYLRTTFAVGSGPSYTTIAPLLEANNDARGGRVLNQLNVEASFELPAYPDIALLTRLQHRSGTFGLVSDSSGSQFATIGFRQRF